MQEIKDGKQNIHNQDVHCSVDSQTSSATNSVFASALNSVEPQLTKLNQNLTSYLPTASKTSQQMINHLFGTEGKRIRPALFFLSARLFDYAGKHLYPIAAVCEFVHTASLLHDDVVDNSPLRRNKPTAHTLWGDESAILVGDLIYARASEMMAETECNEIVKGFAQSIRHMSEGELLQLEHIYNAKTTITDYLTICRCKTAALISMSCKAAGLLAGATPEHCRDIEEFGQAVGLAFQLVDDALDFIQQSADMGKPTLADIQDGKITLPILLLKECMTHSETAKLNSLIEASHIDQDALTWILESVSNYGTVQASLERAQEYSQQAIRSLRKLPNNQARHELEALVERLVWRTQ